MSDQTWRSVVPLTTHEFQLLGEVTALGSLIDAVAEGLVAILAGGDSWQDFIDQNAGKHVSERFDQLQMLLDAENDPEITAWLPAARSGMNDRNELVHAIWLDREGQDIGVGRSKRQAGFTVRAITVAEITEVRDELAGAYLEGLELLNARYAVRPRWGQRGL